MRTRHRYLLIPALLFCFCISCKKTEKEIIYLQGARSSFTTTVFLPSINNRVEGTAHVVDSAFYFNNLSDTGARVSYHWDFGDGNVSTEKEPVHRYAAVGAYTVTLETRVHDIPSDTSAVTLRVIKGQSLISLDEKTDTRGIDMIQTDDGGFLLLGSSQVRDPASPTVNYFLMKLNQRHEQVSLLPLPNGQQYVSLTAAKDGKFLLTSRAGDNDPVNLTLTVSLTDTRISSVPYDGIDIKSVTATSDGGFLFTSSRNAYTPQNQFLPHTYLLKTDGNGSIQWTRFFTGSDALYNGSTVYEDGDGYVLAGSDEFNHTSSFTCPSCQILSLIRMNQSGAPVWRRRTPWASIYGGGTAWVSRLPDSRFIVSTRQNRSLYYFSAQTGLDDRKLLPLPSEGITVSTSGTIVSIGQEIGGNLQAVVMGMNRSGQLSWQKDLPTLQLISKNYSCCFVSTPVKIIPLREGGSLLLATRSDATDRLRISKVVLLELDDQGNPM